MNHRVEQEKEFYQSVRNKVKKDLKDVVTNLIHKTRDNFSREAVDADTVVSEVSKVISSSDAYRALKRSLVMGIVDEKSEHNRSLDDKRNDWEGCLNNSFASLNSRLSSSSHCSYVILDIKDLQVATKLLQSPSLQDKLQSLNVLRQTSSLEQFLSPQVWPSLRLALKETLFHSVVTIGEFCLDIYVNMMVCSLPFVVKESYTTLLEFMSSYKIKDETIQSSHLSDDKIFMQAVCITNKFQQCISKHWLRYPQNIMEEIVKNTFKHFSLPLNQANEQTITAWTIMTIIDTNNIWLKNWLHGRLSRRFVINAIHEYPEITKRALKILNGFANETAIDMCTHKKHHNILLYEVSCSICFLSRLLQYSEGRKLISTINTPETLSICDVWNDIIKCIMVLCNSNYKFFNCNTDFASQAIYCLWESTICTWNVEKRVMILKPLLLPFEYCKMDNIDSHMFVINETAKLLSAVSMVDSARIDLCNLNLDRKFKDIIHWLINGSSSKFLGMHNLLNEILINVVKIFRNMLQIPHGILLGKYIVTTLMLIQSFQTCWSRNSDCETPTFQQNIIDKNETLKPSLLHEEISKAMSALLSSPLGTSLLCETTYLHESINYLIEGYSGLCENSSTRPICNCYYRCFTWFSLYSSYTEAVQKNKLLLTFPNNIWQHFNHTDDYIIDQNLKYISVINKLKSLMFLYPTTIALYDEILSNTDTSDVNEVWKSICLLLLDDIFPLAEDTKYIGSSLLCSLVCSVKTFLYLEQKLKIRAFLLSLLNSHTLDGIIIIDENSILWNHVLVRSYTIGGPKERKLPPKYIKNISENYSWPFVSQESVKKNYLQFETKIQLEGQVDLPFIKPIGNYQINFFREIFIGHLQNNGQMKFQQLSILLEEVVKCLAKNVGFNFSCTSVQNLSDNENIGMELATQYGISLGLFAQPDNSMKELENTLKACKVSLNDTIFSNEFDIFVTTVFLLMKGDKHKTCALIDHYIHTHSCLYNWILPLQILRCCKLQHCHAILSQYFEVIVKETIPKVFSAFQICGLSPSAILWHWTSQCFWNYLNWIEICHWVLLTVTFGGGTILYFAVAVLKHLEQDILLHTQSLTLVDYLKESSISDFQICHHVNLILKLSEKFNDQIQCSIEECTEG